MIRALSFNRSKREQALIENACRLLVGKRTEDTFSFCPFLSGETLERALEKGLLIHFLYFEISGQEDVRTLKDIRKAEPSALLMVLASAGISPMSYCSPGISPDALLLRPFGKKEFDQVNEELFSVYEEQRETAQDDSFFTVHTREENCRIPYSRILYFEASNKKILVRVGSEEYEFYGSMDSIAEDAPDYFLRTHRSYLVNRRKILRMQPAEGLLELEHGAFVPVSRTYRREIKELLG